MLEQLITKYKTILNNTQWVLIEQAKFLTEEKKAEYKEQIKIYEEFITDLETATKK